MKGQTSELDPAIDIESSVDAYTPLEATGYGIRLLGSRGSLSSHVVYLGDPNSLADLTEFWNIRAAGHSVMFVPKDHVDPHLSRARSLVAQGSYQLNPNYRNKATLLRGHGVDEDECKQAEVAGLAYMGLHLFFKLLGHLLLSHHPQDHGSQQ